MSAPRHNRVQLWFWLIVLAAAAAHGSLLFISLRVLREFRWPHHPVHAAVEMTGAVIAVYVAVQLVLPRIPNGSTGFDPWIAGALMVMGLLDGIHALCHAGQTFVWLHSAATLLGGVMFALVWLPAAVTRRVDWWPWVVGFLAAALGCGSFLWPDAVPEMIRDGQFTPAARAFHLVGGGLLFLAAIRLALAYHRTRTVNHLLFVLHCLLFGSAALMFEFSQLWDLAWWGWHGLRLAAYGVAAVFVVSLDRHEARQSQARLAQLVRERTRELQEKTEQLRIGDERFHLVGRCLAVWDWDVAADRVWWNRGLAILFGHDVHEANAQWWYDRIHPDDRTKVQGVFQQAVREGKTTWSDEYRFRKADDSYAYVHDEGVTLTDERGQTIRMLGAMVDVTQLQALNEALAQSNADLQQFANVASHDLHEPLRAVAGFAELLRERYAGRLDDEADEYLRFTVDGARRMQTLINDLLNYSRVQTQGQPFTSVDCEAAFGVALSNLRVALDESCATVTHDPLPTVIADGTQLVRVFQNLIANAVKYRGLRRPEVHVSAQEVAGEWQFSVRDNGIGIRADDLERIFVIFERLHTRAEYPGTGIGLAIVKRIAERHQGRAWAESQPGVGSTFFFTLPKRSLSAAARRSD